MSRHLVDAPDGTDVQHTIELEHITDVPHEMAADAEKDATELKDSVNAVFNIVSCKSQCGFCGSY